MGLMRSSLRLAVSSLSGRRLRTGLLVAAVALSTSLVVAVSCAISSVNAALTMRVENSIGSADVRVQSVGGKRFDAGTLDIVRSWPEVDVVSAMDKGAVPLRERKTKSVGVAVVEGVDPTTFEQLKPVNLEAGEPVRHDGEIVLEHELAEQLGVGPGAELEVRRFGAPIKLRVVGVSPPPPLRTFRRPGAIVTRATLAQITHSSGKLQEISILLRRGVDPFEFARKRAPELPENLVLEPTTKATSGLHKNIRSSQIMFVIVSVLAFISASFIILTGLTTSVIERQRELAVLRCVGGSRAQIAATQLGVGVILGGLGAIVGVPLGVAMAWAASRIYSEQLSAGLHISTLGLALGSIGATLSGLGGAVWPAMVAARQSPLAGLTVRARQTSKKLVVGSMAFGLMFVLAQRVIVTAPDNAQVIFWGHVTLGMPLMFLGYFLLGAPLVIGLATLLGPGLSLLLGLPRRMLTRSVQATPFRHGFTAGSLMVGLAIMTVIWSAGSAALRDWVGAIEFPDAFVNALQGLTPEQRQRVDDLPFVLDTCAISFQRVGADAFGVKALQSIGTTFIGFEPEPFFRMTKLRWIEGDPDEAKRRIEEGGAVLVAQEFKVARGLGVGDTIKLDYRGEPIEFDIVGVIASPGLDLAAKYFSVGEQLQSQALHAIFGSRREMIDTFHNDTIQLLQIDLSDDVSDEVAIPAIRRAIGPLLVIAGSGREIKEAIETIGAGSLTVLSSVAVAAVLIACFGVANIVVAGIDARRFEFGVLRAVGAEGSLLARLVIGEVVIVALGACILGTAMGLQGGATGVELQHLLLGLNTVFKAPIRPIAVGWGIVFVFALAASAPAAMGLARRSPRALLGATRG